MSESERGEAQTSHIYTRELQDIANHPGKEISIWYLTDS
jgi:hypothetical protein